MQQAEGSECRQSPNNCNCLINRLHLDLSTIWTQIYTGVGPLFAVRFKLSNGSCGTSIAAFVVEVYIIVAVIKSVVDSPSILEEQKHTIACCNRFVATAIASAVSSSYVWLEGRPGE